MPDIRIESLLDGARRASGAVAVIDVFRAFTTAAVAFGEGAERIVMVGEVEDALALRRRGIAQLCIGEVGGKAPPGFDLGNSPHELLRAVEEGLDIRGRTLVQRTGAGTQGIAAARGSAARLYAAALVTARATARALLACGEERITLVAMGNTAVVRTDEDELCALHIRNLLEGRAGDADAVRRIIMVSKEAAWFGDPMRPHMPRGDLDIALDIDRFDFAVAVAEEDGWAVARRAT
ncbi:MAG TPA: 2-phosphosulfolactate phosphatase [Dongiaceae bacterium]|jgi:2-phosphosulfolactate phosphatase|nr:2-phosphosulfolactate phosphatase [Dongiaceae bacterium]